MLPKVVFKVNLGLWRPLGECLFDIGHRVLALQVVLGSSYASSLVFRRTPIARRLR